MNVMVRILFDKPAEEDWQAMRCLANQLTNDPESVRVTADPESPGWLMAGFTMPTEAQYKAVERIYRALRFEVENRRDSTISFPYTEAERARAERKAARRRARRKGNG